MAWGPFDRGWKAGLAVLTLAGFALPSAPASAQGFFGLFDDHMSVADTVQSLNRQGFVVHTTLLQRGEVYVCDATGPTGHLERLIVDSHTGRIVQRFTYRTNPYRSTTPRYAYAPQTGGGFMTPPPTPDDAGGWQAPRPEGDSAYLRQDGGYSPAPDNYGAPAPVQHDFLGVDDARGDPRTNANPYATQKPKPVRPKTQATESASLPNAVTPPASAAPTTPPPPVEAARPPVEAAKPPAPPVEAAKPTTVAPPVVAAKPPQPAAPPPPPVEAAKPAPPVKSAAPVEAQKPATPHKNEGVMASSGAAAPAPSPAPVQAPVAPSKKSVNDIPVAPLD